MRRAPFYSTKVLRQVIIMNMKKGLFIVIDGLGGSGKTTLVNALKAEFGTRVVATQEPGGAPRAEKIRDILKSGEGLESDPLTDFFLFWAARAEHVSKTIVPALKKGKIVISDRFDSSTYAMQVVGEKRKDFEKLFWQCRAQALKNAEPDLYILLDAPFSVIASRRKGRGGVRDRFDERSAAYQQLVTRGYKEFAKHIGKKAVRLNVSGNVPKAVERTLKILAPILRKK